MKSGRRARELTEAVTRDETAVFFESPHRIEKTLAALEEICPARQVCIARELTKTHEEFLRGTPAELLAHFQARPPKGEITLLIAPPTFAD